MFIAFDRNRIYYTYNHIDIKPGISPQAPNLFNHLPQYLHGTGITKNLLAQ